MKGDEPAFPRIDAISGGEGEHGNDYHVHVTGGLTKREWYEGMAMQGLLAGGWEVHPANENLFGNLKVMSGMIADSMLESADA